MTIGFVFSVGHRRDEEGRTVREGSAVGAGKGMSRRSAAREFGLARKTVSKVLGYSLPPGYWRLLAIVFGVKPDGIFDGIVRNSQRSDVK